MFGVSEIERKFMGIGQVDKHVLYLVAITILLSHYVVTKYLEQRGD